MKGRLCTVYKGSRERGLYLYVEKKNSLEAVPAGLLERMGTLSEVMTLHLTARRKLARADAAKVLEAITAQGFYLQLPPSGPEGDDSHGN